LSPDNLSIGRHYDVVATRADAAMVFLLTTHARRTSRRGDRTAARDGGMAAWITAVLPVVRGRRTMSLERQVRIAAGTLAATGGLLAALL
jgi:hypothetical protein